MKTCSTFFDVSQEFYSTWTETPQQVTGRQPPSAPVPALGEKPCLASVPKCLKPMEKPKNTEDPCDKSTGAWSLGFD